MEMMDVGVPCVFVYKEENLSQTAQLKQIEEHVKEVGSRTAFVVVCDSDRRVA